MSALPFYSPEGSEIPSLTANEMREVDRIAVEEFQLGILQMMENAGRNLAQIVMSQLKDSKRPVVVLAGPGGNGGGGLSAARHLHNHGINVRLILSTSELGQPASNQLEILSKAGVLPLREDEVNFAMQGAEVVVDALIGYGLTGAPRGRAAELIRLCNQHTQRVVSLDIPSGVDSTTGEALGEAVNPHVTVTLALPKTGLAHISGELFLADIGIPPEVFALLGIFFEPFFAGKSWIALHRTKD